ncbi:transcription activator [Legionella geestiana]|uniref:Transcription activator n=1 Tax=Legionella geestiana TaxID=45065 RepID=A0A0W0TTR9_9GAMM|nr:effector binding domain-containing protein [Legionella geestiana]KTC98821.1 transcription activator [Legionella geestiana]QBS12822.1 AraC family transcriptional regulator [Legionella geestiana]QDQ39459.1 AraC family transcriptional regulator [Legionella geestiana]STX54694.1 Transcription activator, effector binding [Legionella geestiana]
MLIVPTIEHIEGFTVSGWSVRTQNTDEANEKTAKLPGLWQRFYAGTPAAIATVYGVYSDYESDVNGFYSVTAGVASCYSQTELSTVSIQTGNYLVFHGNGPLPVAVVEIWKRVWDFFKTNRAYNRSYISDFEAYNGSNQVAVYIGFKATYQGASSSHEKH